MEDLIYLDNAATTKTDPKVVEAMLPYYTELYGNASSKHEFGVKANDAVKTSRKQIAELIGCNFNEIIFTSGATESINMAMKGLVEFHKNKSNHIITVKTEHSAVLDTCEYLEKRGVEVTYLSVDSEGIIDLKELKSSIKANTILVSVMYANNEIGVLQPIEEISKICHENGILFMSDATQAVGKIPINVYEQGIDIMPFSGHKFHGPKGIGGLFLRSKRPFKAKIEPLLHGGGHEKGLRSGTLNVPLIVGIGKAAEITHKEMSEHYEKMLKLRNELEDELLKIDGCHLNGQKEKRLPNITNVRFDGIDSDALLVNLEKIAISKGSACSSDNLKPSHVLLALGIAEDDTYSSIRISNNKFNIIDEIKFAITSIKRIIIGLREVSN